ncbi:MAG: hypothetical protein RKO66_08520 [Candidatus Contendobacter sp.]|nr:hypothetical protein [Candidatus Contendobacter sp.]
MFGLKQAQPKESAIFALAPEILFLENGDRLTRKEFERRYQAMPRLKKAELIEGVVFIPSPLHFEQHADSSLTPYCACRNEPTGPRALAGTIIWKARRN